MSASQVTFREQMGDVGGRVFLVRRQADVLHREARSTREITCALLREIQQTLREIESVREALAKAA